MEAGRALDALIAEKIMGWKRDGLWLINPDGQRWEINSPDALQFVLPPYSTDISAAWGVVEKLFQDGWWTTVERTWDGDTPQANHWEVRLLPSESLHRDDNIEARALTAPHAIALAALRACGVEP